MTDIEQKALALAEAWEPRFVTPWTQGRKDALVEIFTKHLRAIEQHEAFRREVSDAVAKHQENMPWAVYNDLTRFIIPKPVDPLVEALVEALNEALGRAQDYEAHDVEDLRAAMKARGYEFTKIGEAGE